MVAFTSIEGDRGQALSEDLLTGIEEELGLETEYDLLTGIVANVRPASRRILFWYQRGPVVPAEIQTELQQIPASLLSERRQSPHLVVTHLCIATPHL